jgi:hypothetical protein
LKLKPELQHILTESDYAKKLTADDFVESNVRTLHMIDFIQLNALLGEVSSKSVPDDSSPKEKLQLQVEFLKKKQFIMGQAVKGNL